jgi:hypothetical protein
MSKFWEWCKENPKTALSLIPAIPAVLTTIAGALASANELYDSVVTGSEFGKSSYAIEQKTLWEANISCLAESKFNKIKNQHNVEIGTLICKSGDVLISNKKPDDDTESYRWVSWNNVDSGDSAMLFNISLMPEAYAGEKTNVCSVELPNGNIKQRIKDDWGYCWDITVNPYNGKVIEKVPVDCNEVCS